jgi:hypothetical protein
MALSISQLMKDRTMNTQHTKGPWVTELNPTIAEGCQVSAYSDEGNRVLQVVVRSFNSDADRRLIVESPALLEALEWALSQIEDDLDPDHQAAFAEATATAARARGAA